MCLACLVGMACAWSLSRFPERFEVEVWESLAQAGGVASTCTIEGGVCQEVWKAQRVWRACSGMLLGSSLSGANMCPTEACHAQPTFCCRLVPACLPYRLAHCR